MQSDWIVFTSQNGVNTFLWNLKDNGLDLRQIAHAKIAVVGKKTAEALERVALCPDLVPKVQTGRNLAQELIEQVKQSGEQSKQVRVTLFAAKESNKEVEQLLQENSVFQKLVSYENHANMELDSCEGMDWTTYDGIFFTSGSSVKRFLQVSNGVTPKNIYSIGPTCSQIIQKETGKSYQEAEVASYEGLLRLVEQ